MLVPLSNPKLPKQLSLQIARNFEDDEFLDYGRHDECFKKWNSSKGTSVVCQNFFNLCDNHCGGDQGFSEGDYTLSALVNSSQK